MPSSRPTVPVAHEDWRVAQRTPFAELPDLDDRDRAFLQRVRTNPEQYRRTNVLLRQLTLSRQTEQGRCFGEVIEHLLESLAGRYVVKLVTRQDTADGWKVKLERLDGRRLDFWSEFAVVKVLIEDRATDQQLVAFRKALFEDLGEPVILEAAQ